MTLWGLGVPSVQCRHMQQRRFVPAAGFLVGTTGSSANCSPESCVQGWARRASLCSPGAHHLRERGAPTTPGPWGRRSAGKRCGFWDGRQKQRRRRRSLGLPLGTPRLGGSYSGSSMGHFGCPHRPNLLSWWKWSWPLQRWCLRQCPCRDPLSKRWIWDILSASEKGGDMGHSHGKCTPRIKGRAQEG